MAEIFLEVKNGIDETANSFADYLCRIIMNHLEKSDTVLIKGSHSMNLSEITSFLKEICE